MNSALRHKLVLALAPSEKLNLVEWSERHLYFDQNYPTPYRGRYSLDLWPYFREPMEALTSLDIDEVVFCKCSQAGASQNLLIAYALYALAHGLPVIYCGGQSEHVEAFLLERIKPLVTSSASLRQILGESRERGTELYFSNGALLTCTHSTSLQGVKTRPAAVVLGDEVDIWPENTLDKLRSRLTHYPNAKCVIVSAPDARARKTKEKNKPTSPIFAEFAKTDQRYFHLQDSHGNWFKLEMGMAKDGVIPPHGLKWSKDAKRKDGSWDFEMVRQTAHYLTPSGEVIDDAKKRELLPHGKWIATNPSAPKNKRGYHLNALYLPQKTWGDIACRFLEAKRQGTISLQTFCHEFLAEEFWTEKIEAYDSELRQREAEYQKGQLFWDVEPFRSLYKDRAKAVFVTADVQADHGWALVTGVVAGGVFGIIDFCLWHSFAEVAALADKYKAYSVLIDANFRQPEVHAAASQFKFIPTIGKSRENFNLSWTKADINPFLGTARAKGAKALTQITFQVDVLKSEMMARLKGDGLSPLYLYKFADYELVHQLTGERLVDGRFEKVTQQRANHLWDCLILANLATNIFSLNAYHSMPDAPPPEKTLEETEGKAA